jgi:D-xylonolactonase
MGQIEWKLALETRAELGEGLHWDSALQHLWMVDIHGKRLLRWDLSSARADEWTMPQRIGWAIPERGRDSLIVGLQDGFARAWLGDVTRLEWVARPFGSNASLRLNDAKADDTGAIWAGSMNNDDVSCGDGCLFRVATDGTVLVIDGGYKVANGPAISPDGRLMLHTDSARREIYAFDLDAASGLVANKRVWIRLASDEGFPDGMCFDAEGCVWIAHWAAGCVTRRSPRGQLIRRIDFPAPLITNVCFAGPEQDRMFVTSAWTGMSVEARSTHPLAGSLFEVTEPGVAGAPTFPCTIA